jgi:hypothetical protein
MDKREDILSGSASGLVLLSGYLDLAKPSKTPTEVQQVFFHICRCFLIGLSCLQKSDQSTLPRAKLGAAIMKAIRHALAPQGKHYGWHVVASYYYSLLGVWGQLNETNSNQQPLYIRTVPES